MSDYRPNRLVAVDTNVLVFGVRKKGPKEKIQQARWLFEELDRCKAQIIVPAIVLSEYVTKVKADERAATAALIADAFQVEPFDIRDVVTAAELWDHGKATRKTGVPNSRIALRADILIIATAKNHGAMEVYSDDADFRALASKIMTARPLPSCAPNLLALIE